MKEIHETTLPGVGIRHDFKTRSGERIGVISHHTGRRDLLIYDRFDPDACKMTVRLSEEDSHTLTDILGASKIVEHVQNIQQSVAGLALDWVPIRENWPCAGQSLREINIRANTGVSVVAIIRDGETFPSPDADFELHSGDTAVVVGTPEGVEKTFALLREG